MRCAAARRIITLTGKSLKRISRNGWRLFAMAFFAAVILGLVGMLWNMSGSRTLSSGKGYDGLKVRMAQYSMSATSRMRQAMFDCEVRGSNTTRPTVACMPKKVSLAQPDVRATHTYSYANNILPVATTTLVHQCLYTWQTHMHVHTYGMRCVVPGNTLRHFRIAYALLLNGSRTRHHSLF
jgi:hypothetical protein